MALLCSGIQQRFMIRILGLKDYITHIEYAYKILLCIRSYTVENIAVTELNCKYIYIRTKCL